MTTRTTGADDDGNTTSANNSKIAGDQCQQEQEAMLSSPRNDNNNNDFGNNNKKQLHRLRLVTLLKKAAATAVEKGDPWAKYEMHQSIPAERVVRHFYHRSTNSWTSDETIVKMEPKPFTHGAMRFCYRLKKRATLPESASNHRFHNYGWTRASNYVAKTYHTKNNNNNTDSSTCSDNDGIDTSEQAKEAVRNDVALQYEAAHWAERFNSKNPPKQIIFIRTYALEFPNRPGQPWFAVERFIAGTDMYGCGFVKHNTNSGFVDEDLHRITPQVFSAFSFYESQGERLVADIQGVGDLYTDPQVLSSDYRFGDGDLGPRGMALFFHSFRHNTLANSMGIPVFPLSKNELKRQAKYDDGADDCDSLSSANSSFREACKHLDRFAAMDLNRSRRMAMAAVPPREIVPDELKATEKRSNAIVTISTPSTALPCRDDVRNALRQSCRQQQQQCKKSPVLAKPKFARHASEIDEVKVCLDLAKKDYTFDNQHAYHRMASGEMPATKMNAAPIGSRHRSSLLIRTVSAPMAVNETTRDNLGRVHYQLAVLHGMGRFPDDVPQSGGDIHDDDDNDDVPAHDVFSVLFHLAHAASMQNVAACLALGRLHAGLPSCVSNLLQSIVPIDFDMAKNLLRRAMQSVHPSPACVKAAAGCLLYQIYRDEQDSDHDILDDNDDLDVEITTTTTTDKVSEGTIMHLLEDVLHLMSELEAEKIALDQHQKKKKVAGLGGMQYHAGDRVEGNYCLEGSYYPGVVESVATDSQSIVVKYDDDGSMESLSLEHVRLTVPPTATQTALGGPLSDEEAFNNGNSDDTKCIVEICELRAELAGHREKAGNKAVAAALYEEASNEAMAINKMKKAAEWSMKAAALME